MPKRNFTVRGYRPSKRPRRGSGLGRLVVVLVVGAAAVDFMITGGAQLRTDQAAAAPEEQPLWVRFAPQRGAGDPPSRPPIDDFRNEEAPDFIDYSVSTEELLGGPDTVLPTDRRDLAAIERDVRALYEGTPTPTPPEGTRDARVRPRPAPIRNAPVEPLATRPERVDPEVEPPPVEAAPVEPPPSLPEEPNSLLDDAPPAATGLAEPTPDEPET